MAGKTAILSLKIIGDATSAQKAAADTKKEISGIEKAAAASKKALGVAGLAAGGALMMGLDSAIEQSGSKARTAAALGLNPEDAAKAGALTGKLYAENYGGSMEEVSNTVEGVASTLADLATNGGADVDRLTKKALNLASTFPEVGDGVATAGILVQTGLAKTADEAYDLMAGTLTQIPKAMQSELFPVMDEYSKHFSALGIDGTTAFGIMAQASKGGAIQMDKTGDALKEFTIRATDGSKATADAYKAIGLDAEEMARKIAASGPSAQEAFAKTVAGLQSIEDPAAQAQAAIGLFGTPLEDLGTDKIPEFLGAIDPAGDSFDSLAGAAEKMGQTLAGSPSASLESFKRQAGASFTEIAAGALPVLQPILALLMQFAPVLGPAAVAIAAVAAITWAATAATSAYSAAVTIGQGIAKAATAAQWLWNAALSANPIGVVIILIAALVAGVIWAYNNLGWFKDAVNTAGAVAQAIFTAIVKWVMDVVKWLDDTLAPIGGIQGALDIMGAAAAVIFKGITDGIAGMIGWIRDAIGWFGKLFGAKNDANSVQVDGGGAGGSPMTLMARQLDMTGADGIEYVPQSRQLTKVAGLMAAPQPLAGVSTLSARTEALTAGGAIGSTGRSIVYNNTYNLEVKAGPGTDRVKLGRELMDLIQTAERAGGRKGGIKFA